MQTVDCSGDVLVEYWACFAVEKTVAWMDGETAARTAALTGSQLVVGRAV